MNQLQLLNAILDQLILLTDGLAIVHLQAEAMRQDDPKLKSSRLDMMESWREQRKRHEENLMELRSPSK